MCPPAPLGELPSAAAGNQQLLAFCFAPALQPHTPPAHRAEINKSTDLDWFTIKPSNKEGTHWEGKCWYIHEYIKYEFDFQVGAGLGVVGKARRTGGVRGEWRAGRRSIGAVAQPQCSAPLLHEHRSRG